MSVPSFKSGKITTGAAGTLESIIPESGDEVSPPPKTPKVKGSKVYRAFYPPLNLITPAGRSINFVNGYFVTADVDIIAYLAKHVGKTCELR